MRDRPRPLAKTAWDVAADKRTAASASPRFLLWSNDKPGHRSPGDSELLQNLKAENKQLRDKAVQVALQIQALRDGQFASADSLSLKDRGRQLL
jgi:hypothetical protein